ncbi:MAG: hypothetical protein H6867_09745 [Rhodospirillales bacterium]|nr:hypothetical protein [Rhodospirillales bacterium]MCB9995936.1 hypothetical protein [Rhodospirillales bacterium]
MARLLDRILGSRETTQDNTPSFSTKGRLSLTFKCVVQDGEGAFSRMVFPGRKDVPDAPEDWPGPKQMQPGSLNCRVVEFPDDFYDLVGEGDRIAALDTGHFEPEFRIPRELIKNNRVGPYAPDHNPDMGIAQVWRCAVRNDDTGEEFDAWHSRRIDGTYPPFHKIIELMADRKLRDAHKLENGTNLTITMYSKAQL